MKNLIKNLWYKMYLKKVEVIDYCYMCYFLPKKFDPCPGKCYRKIFSIMMINICIIKNCPMGSFFV